MAARLRPSGMRHAAAAAVVALLAAHAWAHGGCYGDPRPSEELPPASTGPQLAEPAPGDARHRCPPLRAGRGEVPPGRRAPDDPPPPPTAPPGGEGPLALRLVRTDGARVTEACVWAPDGRQLASPDATALVRCDPGPHAAWVVVTAGGCAPRAVRWVGAARREPSEVVLAAGCALEGSVAFADGSPATGVHLRVTPDADRVPEEFGVVADALPWRFATWTRDDGSFVLDGLAAGPYRLVASVRGMPATTIARVSAGAGDAQRVVLPAALSPRERCVTVRFVDAARASIPQFVVDVDALDGVHAEGAVLRGAGPEGADALTLRFVAIGPLHVRAARTRSGCVGPGRPTACAHDVCGDDVELTLCEPAAGTPAASIVLAAPASRHDDAFVRVIDTTRALPVTTLWLGASGLAIPVHPDGVFDIVVSRARGPGALVGWMLPSVAAGSSLVIGEPPAPRSLAGRVLRRDGTPVVAARVRARAASDTPDTDVFLDAWSDADGRFLLTGVCGTLALDVAAPGLVAATPGLCCVPGGPHVTLVCEETRAP